MAATTVYNFAELKLAVTDLTITEIYLGADIIFNTSGGAVIPRAKSTLVIDGLSQFKITDWLSSGSGDTLRVQNASGAAQEITLRNLSWSGRNYYGMTYVPEGDNFSNVTLNVENVSYTGPQALFNRRGITRINNSEFFIRANEGSVAPQEFAEINRLFISGTVTVNSQATQDAVIWFTYYNTALTVEPSAVFTVVNTGTYMFYSDVSTPAMLFAHDSITHIETRRGLWLYASATAHIASSFTVERNAEFYALAEIVSGSNIPVFKCASTFTAEEGSLFYLAVKGGTSAAPLMYFAQRAQISFNNPKSVVLYNATDGLFSFGAGTAAQPNYITIDAEMVNRWQTAAAFAVAGTFDDPPTRAFAKLNGENVHTQFETTTTAMRNLVTNIVAGDAGAPMDITTFNIFTARVLSFGTLPLTVQKIVPQSTAITGKTEPEARVRAQFDAQTLNADADAAGDFSLPLVNPPAAGTVVTVGSNWRFLTKFTECTVIGGTLEITHLEPLVFYGFAVPYPRPRIRRLDADWYIEVTDTREAGGDWELFVSLPAPLSNGSAELDNALILVESDQTRTLTPQQILIHRGEWGTPPKITRITWDAADGFWLSVTPNYPYEAGQYTAMLECNLVEVQGRRT